jgi:hypothetical protein
MRKYLFPLLILSVTSFKAVAQRNVKDSLKYYYSEINKIRKRFNDSIFNSPSYKLYSENASRLRINSDDYVGFHLYFQTASTNFSTINRDYNTLGFSGFNNSAYSIGMGLSFKKNRRIFDLNLLTFGIAQKSKSGTGTLKTTFDNAFQFEWGYDFIKKKTINIFPYAGLGFRSQSLQYQNKISYNSSPTNITNIIQNNTSTSDYNTSLSFQAGLGMDFVLTNPKSNGGVILCIKAGTNRPFRNKDFSFGSFSYDPKFNYGAWYITTGFKFFGR